MNIMLKIKATLKKVYYKLTRNRFYSDYVYNQYVLKEHWYRSDRLNFQIQLEKDEGIEAVEFNLKDSKVKLFLSSVSTGMYSINKAIVEQEPYEVMLVKPSTDKFYSLKTNYRSKPRRFLLDGTHIYLVNFKTDEMMDILNIDEVLCNMDIIDAANVTEAALWSLRLVHSNINKYILKKHFRGIV